MVIFGLILLLAALGLGALAVYGLPTSGSQISWNFLGNTFAISPVTIFFLGAAAMLALLLGVWLMGLGTRRSARRASELRSLRKEQKHQAKVDAERARYESTPTTHTVDVTGTTGYGEEPGATRR